MHGAAPYPLPSLSFAPGSHIPNVHVHAPRRTTSLSPNQLPNPLPPHQMPHHVQQRPDAYFAPNAALLYTHATSLMAAAAATGQSPGDLAHGLSAQFATGAAPPRLPPILQVEKQHVTTSATQAASASRRRNEAHFMCPVPGCGSTFTRRFNLRGMLRFPVSHPLPLSTHNTYTRTPFFPSVIR